MLAKLRQLAYDRLPWRKKALLTIQGYAHGGRKGSYVGWQSKEPPYRAVWGCGKDFYRAEWREWHTPPTKWTGVCLLRLEKDSPQGFQDIMANGGDPLVLQLRARD